MNARPPLLGRQAMAQLLLDTDPYLSCDDCFDAVDQAVDEFVLGSGTLTPGFRTHLLGCWACREEATVLAELVAQEAGLDPSSQRHRIAYAVETTTWDRR